jgi:hypothetical protein
MCLGEKMADVSEILQWLRVPENGIPDTDDMSVLEQYREKVADAFDLKPTNQRINEAFEQYLRAPRSFRRVAQDGAIFDPSQSFDDTWIKEAQKKRGRPYWTRLRNFLINERKRPEHLVTMLDDESENILRRIGDPNSDKLARRGLVVGYVQSGKTANMAALMAKAGDAGYKVVIVFAGVLDTLRQQTQLRFDQELLGAYKNDENWAQLPYVKRFRESEYPNWRPGTFALSNDPKEGEIRDCQPKPELLKRDLGPILFVIKKTRVRINLLKEMLERSAKDFDSLNYFPLPTLVIDDESDQATINIKANRGEVAATNNAIRELLNVLKVHSYVGFTATPFANLFIDPFYREADLGRDLFPKHFIYPLKTPSTYFGAKELFGLSEGRDPERENPGLPIFRVIEPKEVNNATRGSIKSLKNDLPKLSEAIDSFVLSCAARIFRGEKTEDMSMLVHPSSYTEMQNKFARPIAEEISVLKNLFTNDNEWSKYRARLKILWESDFQSTSELVANVIGKSNEKKSASVEKVNTGIFKRVEFDQIEKHIPEVLSDLEIKVLHSGSKDYLQFHDKARPKRYIVVGGNKLSRGLTIEGLTISYFVRNSNSYDTLLQMGRWFGYREKYVDLTRLYLTAVARNNFAELAYVELDLREQFRKYAVEGIRPLDMPPRILQIPSMSITARNRMGNAVQLEADFSDSVTQQTSFEFQEPEKIIERNKFWVRFLSQMGTPTPLPRIGSLIWEKEMDTNDLTAIIQNLNLGNLNIKLFSEYLREKMMNGKWIVAVAGKESGKTVAEFEFGAWRGGLVTVERSIKSALQDTTSTVSSPRDFELIGKYLSDQKKDTEKYGYLVLYFLNSDPKELWKHSSGKPPEPYVNNRPPYIIAPVFRVPKIGKGAIKVGLGKRSEEEIKDVYLEQEAVAPDEE